MLGLFIVIITFILLTLTGYIVIRSITKEKNPLVLIPVSQIVGLSLYIFILNIISKIFHGQTGIIISTLVFIIIALFFYFGNRKNWVELNPLKGKSLFFGLLVITSVLIFSILKMFSLLPTGDSSMQWAYAAGFARGNHPLMTPWQPDLLPNYHLGAYFFEGALYSLSGLSFLLIHTLFNVFLLVAGSLMVIFLFWKQYHLFTKLWALVSVLIFFLSFGVIVSIFPNFTSSVQIIEPSKLKDIIPAKGTAGASLVDLSSLSYLPARSLSLGLALVVLYFIKTTFQKKLFKILSLSIILSVTALVEESIFIPLLMVLISALAFSFLPFIPRFSHIINSRKSLLTIFVITIIIVLLQGGFLPNLIFGKEENTASYKIVTPLSKDNFYSNQIFENFYLTEQSPIPYIGWLNPTPLIFVLVLLLYSYIKKDPISGLIGLFAAITLMLFAMIEYEPCPECSTRFLSFGNIASGFGVTYLFIILGKSLSAKKNVIILLLFTLLVLFPTILPDLSFEIKDIEKGRKNKESNTIFTVQQPIPWIKNLIPANERLMVIDTQFPSPAGSLNFQYNGIYTILGPQYTRVIRPQPGIEFFDIALTLNPTLLKQTKTSYIYIESNSSAYKQLPQFRKDELINGSYFQILYSQDYKDSLGNDIYSRLLKVLPRYLDSSNGGKEIENGRLDQLRIIIPKGSQVYLSDYGDTSDTLSFWYRMALQYALKDYEIIMQLGQTTYQVIETTFNRRNPVKGEIYDYYIFPPSKTPNFKAEMIWSNIFASAWKRI